MTTPERAVVISPITTGQVRMTGTESAPLWRGRLHLAAFVLAVPAAVAVAWREQAIAVDVYALALMGLFGTSSAYHLWPMPAGRRQVIRRMDHAMIYLYIAAAYTPFCLDVLRGTLGEVVLALVWCGAAAGMFVKLLAFRRINAVAGALYLVLGWIAALTLPELFRRLGAVDVTLMVVMGLLYTGGVVVLALRTPDPLPKVFGYHEVWHAAVVLACACYFVVIWNLPGITPH